MHCCTPPAGAEIFSEKQARRDARRYRKRGLTDSARWIVEAVPAAGSSVLEIGGGVGALGIELLKAGAERVTNVELSPAYEPEAEQLLRDNGLAGRVDRRVGDALRSDVPAADVVVLNRVVCCNPDVDGLVGLAAWKAGRALALTYPRDIWWSRSAARVLNLVLAVIRFEFRMFIHAPARIAAVAERQGLSPTERRGGIFWQLVAFSRNEPPPSASATS